MKAIEAIERFTEGVTLDIFKADDMRVSAVIRKLEVIGEAVKNISWDIKEKYPQIPWKDMAGMRDKLIHFYFGVKHNLVWNTVTRDIPKLKPVLLKIFREIEKETVEKDSDFSK